jgi:hypothetical protein
MYNIKRTSLETLHLEDIPHHLDLLRSLVGEKKEDIPHAPRNASNGPTMLYQTYDASFVLLCKNDKVVVRNLGPKCKRDKTCIWVPSLM